MKILAVDNGSKTIGLAISDPTGTITRPLMTILHTARIIDAATVAEQARDNEVERIVIGITYDEDGRPSYEGRRAIRFAEALKTQIDLPVVFWDESFTTQDARQARIRMHARRKDRAGHLDALAAALILDSYIEANKVKKITDASA